MSSSRAGPGVVAFILQDVMGRLPSLRRLLPLFALLVAAVAAGPAEAFVIYLKDGSRIISREKPVVKGLVYVFVSTSGNRQMIPVSEVDEAKTESHAAAGFGDSYVMSDAPVQKGPESTQGRSLSDVIKSRKITIQDTSVPGRAAPPEDASAARSSAGPVEGPLVRTAPRAAPTSPYADPQVSDAFTRALETAGVKRVQLVPSAGVLKVQAVTDTEQQVFAALGAVARGLKESRALGRPIEKSEIVFSTSTAENAGRFLMTADDADALLNGKISAAKYFVANAVF